MSAYPIAIDTFRATANLPGLTYNPLDTKTIFAEDLQGLQSSVVAIETELGPTPKGGSANVANRLDDTVAKNGDTMTGPLTVNARIKAGPGSDVIVIDPNGNDYLQMFHSGGAAGYGQLASSTGFVIISGAGRSAAMTSSGAVQCIFQETATWQSVDIGHDGMQGMINTTAGDLVLNSSGAIKASKVFLPVQATTAAAPAYIKGGIYFDTTLNKLCVGGATAWETITSA